MLRAGVGYEPPVPRNVTFMEGIVHFRAGGTQSMPDAVRLWETGEARRLHRDKFGERITPLLRCRYGRPIILCLHPEAGSYGQTMPSYPFSN